MQVNYPGSFKTIDPGLRKFQYGLCIIPLNYHSFTYVQIWYYGSVEEHPYSWAMQAEGFRSEVL
jgi:hypothetical protein